MQPPYDPTRPPYQGYPQAPKSGLPGAVIALVVVGSIMGVIVMGAFAYGVVKGYRQAASASHDPASTALTQSYATTNGLITAHYPADFAAKTLDHATLILSRNFTGGGDEVMTLAGVQPPITNDVHEFARVLLRLVENNVTSKGGTYAETSQRPAKCLGSHPGLEVNGTFKLPATGLYISKSCFFIAGDKGYEFRYDVPESRLAKEAPLLQTIIDATDLGK